MQKIIFSLVVMFTFILPTPSQAQELTGDTRLACEALLCLSSGARPGECSPSISRYFSITRKKWSDTINARRNFLQLCPASSEEGMPTLVEAILDGAGNCHAEFLNKNLTEAYTYLDCDNKVYPEDPCQEKTIMVISDKLPSYCQSYSNHAYTWKIGVRYVGKKLQGGRWVDE